jgi:hypothetical protein
VRVTSFKAKQHWHGINNIVLFVIAVFIYLLYTKSASASNYFASFHYTPNAAIAIEGYESGDYILRPPIANQHSSLRFQIGQNTNKNNITGAYKLEIFQGGQMVERFAKLYFGPLEAYYPLDVQDQVSISSAAISILRGKKFQPNDLNQINISAGGKIQYIRLGLSGDRQRRAEGILWMPIVQVELTSNIIPNLPLFLSSTYGKNFTNGGFKSTGSEYRKI